VIFGGKRPPDRAIPQDELNKLLIAKAREGKCVVRLKGGDPYIFGRGGVKGSWFRLLMPFHPNDPLRQQYNRSFLAVTPAL